jgi:hypothetical protein
MCLRLATYTNPLVRAIQGMCMASLYPFDIRSLTAP